MTSTKYSIPLLFLKGVIIVLGIIVYFLTTLIDNFQSKGQNSDLCLIQDKIYYDSIRRKIIRERHGDEFDYLIDSVRNLAFSEGFIALNRGYNYRFEVYLINRNEINRIEENYHTNVVKTHHWINICNAHVPIYKGMILNSFKENTEKKTR